MGYHVENDEDDDTTPDTDEYALFKEQENKEKTEEDNDEKEVEQQLERFFQKLTEHKFPVLDMKVIKVWEDDMQSIQKMLDDEQKDLDLESISKRVMSSLLQHAPNLEKYDTHKHSSIIDYYEMRIEEAKLAFHRQELLDLYNGWKTGDKQKGVSPYTVLSNLEHIAEENNMFLLYEWLDGDEADEEIDNKPQ